MRITRSIAAALLCLTTAAVTTGVAAADPAPDEPRPALEVAGSDHGVGYRVALSQDRHAAVSTLRAGRFLATWDAESVAVTDDSGRQVANLPLRYDIAGKRVDLEPAIDQTGRRLTLTPAAQESAPLRDVEAQQRLFDVVQQNLPAVATGAALGAAVGFVVGFPAGLFILDFITVPITTVLGGLIGGAAGLYASGGQPALDVALDAASAVVPGLDALPR
ncbi:hypothetical protein [Nocardia terpenica]|uniref:DUF8020 domain-containing protein n=1 Tax=Nocardia terpenica TaxID=455432 RepID=A0A291RTN6_9NOCA|nr:hypothetical protein [Nocardia terpenica]ATL70873.1 hypothetical protein CRH09_36510 [Nocardia terpenica]